MTWHLDPDAMEKIGRLYREAGGVTDIRYSPEKISASRNADACHWCHLPFAGGQVRYPILDELWLGWGLVCLCVDCFDLGKNEGHFTKCMGTSLDRYERACAGCGQPMHTPTVGPFRWLVCSNRCRQRLYRKRRRGLASVVDWKAHPPKCETCKKPIKAKRRDSRFCSNACRQWLYRRRKA